MSLPIPGIYSVPNNPTVFIYFTGEFEEPNSNWLTYYFLTDDPETDGKQYEKTSCTTNSNRYDPTHLIIPCTSFTEAKHIFTKENYPKYFI